MIDLEKINRIAGKVAKRLNALLNGKKSVFEKQENAVMVNGETCSYFVSVNKTSGDEIVLHEMIQSEKDRGVTSCNWVLNKKGEQWTIANAEKDGTTIESELLFNEIDETLERLTHGFSGERNLFEVPSSHKQVHTSYVPVIKRGYAAVYPLVAAAVLVFGLFITLFINSLQYTRMTRIVNRLDAAIIYNTESNDRAVTALTEQLESVNNDIRMLQEDVRQEREAFEFSRKNTAMDIRRQADELPWSHYARKNAYEYIATQIEHAGSYGEIIFQISRLPETNAQATTLMATEKSRVVPLADYSPLFPSMQFPVRLDGEENNGEDFLVTSHFTERRLDPLGAGGYSPHRAIDIINIGNILFIEADSSMHREEDLSGAVVASADGTVVNINYNDVYGWNMEVRHEVNDEVLETYTDATSWSTFYAHMEERGAWKIGDRVKASEKLGNIGNTGISTGPHLHFEVRIYHPHGNYWSLMGRYDKVEPYRI